MGPMHCERRLLTTLIARDVTDPGPVPIRVLDSSLLMGGTVAWHPSVSRRPPGFAGEAAKV